MNDFIILTDSSCDLPVSVAEELGVEVLSLEVTVEGEEPRLNADVDVKEFYAKLRDEKKTAKTAAVNMDSFCELFDKHLSQGKDVLYLGFSSGLSATYANGRNAAEELAEKYPDRKVYAVDTLCACLGQGLIVTLAARKAAAGATIEEVRDYVEENKLKLCHWFTVNDLFFLKRGGRVSASTAVLGSVLAIKPVLHVDDEGHLINMSKARGRDASIKALFERMKETAIDPASNTVYIGHGDCYDEAKKLADMITAEFGNKDILVSEIGAVIGAHSGPGTIALFFLGNER